MTLALPLLAATALDAPHLVCQAGHNWSDRFD
jgi:hypothetical protein